MCLNLTAQVFQVPDDFDILAYLADELKAQPLIAVRMLFAPQAAHVAHYNRVYWESIEEQPDGSVLVTMHTPDLMWAASSALAYGPLVKVLDPPALQSLVAGWAQAIHEQYRTPNEQGSRKENYHGKARSQENLQTPVFSLR